MAEQITKPKPSRQRQASTEAEELEGVEEAGARGRELISELGELLDEIDEVLESDATEFVASYVQRGGQ